MNPILRNILAVIAGFVVGSVVNMAIISIGPFVVPPPAGADLSTMETLRDSMKLFTPINFLFPFLAHAIGTLAGAFIAAKLAATQPVMIAVIVSVLFLIGGVVAANMLGSPMWFNLLDLVLAYIPMGYLGGVLGRGKRAL